MSQLQWGRRYDLSQQYSPDYCCPTCNWRPEKFDTFGNYTIGIDSDGPKSRQATRPYTQIVECPKDFTVFWAHTDRRTLEIYKNLYPAKFKDLVIEPENHREIKMK